MVLGSIGPATVGLMLILRACLDVGQLAGCLGSLGEISYPLLLISSLSIDLQDESGELPLVYYPMQSFVYCVSC